MSREGRDRPSKGIKEPRHRQTLENRCAARSYMIGQCLEHQINSARVDYQRCNIKPFFFPWIPVILGKETEIGEDTILSRFNRSYKRSAAQRKLAPISFISV